jgi:hypothetical protein
MLNNLYTLAISPYPHGLIVPCRHDLAGVEHANGEHEPGVPLHLAQLVSVDAPQLHHLVVRARHEADPRYLRELTDYIVVPDKFTFEVAFKPDADFFILAARDCNAVLKGEDGGGMGVVGEGGGTLTCLHVPEAGGPVPGPTHYLLRYRLAN